MTKNDPKTGGDFHPLGGYQASDYKCVSKMLTGLHAIQIASGTDAAQKFRLLATGLSDPTLRQIADEAAHRARELTEQFVQKRKNVLRKEYETPEDKVKVLKTDRLRSLEQMKDTDPVYFLLPKENESVDPDSDIFLGLEKAKSTPMKKKLLQDFEDVKVSEPLSADQKAALARRLKFEIDNDSYSPGEIAEATAMVRQSEEFRKRAAETHSTLNEALAVQEVYNLACVYILKFAANDELTKCRDTSNGRFKWNLKSTEVESSALLTHSEDFKSRAHNVSAGTPARVAMNQFELDVIKYEWFISLLLDRATIPEKVASLKSLLVGKLETLLESSESILRNIVASDSEVRQGTKSKFEFYKFHLGLQGAAKPPAPAVRFMSHDHEGSDAPLSGTSGAPDHFIGAMGAKGSRPLSAHPGAKCTEERRRESFTKNTTIDTTYEPGSHGGDESPSEHEERGSNPQGRKRSAREDRSRSPPPKRATRNNGGFGKPQEKPGAPPADLTRVVRLLGDLTKKISNLEQKGSGDRTAPFRSSDKPRGFQQRPRLSDIVVPEDACPRFVKGEPCVGRCGANHGKFALKYRGGPAQICRSETNKKACPFLWTEKGCYSKHSCSKNA